MIVFWLVDAGDARLDETVRSEEENNRSSIIEIELFLYGPYVEVYDESSESPVWMSPFM